MFDNAQRKSSAVEIIFITLRIVSCGADATSAAYIRAGMTTIITGNFQQQAEAQQALSDLAGAGFAADQTTTFYVSPAGHHDLYPGGGDEDESPGMEHAAGGAASGAAVSAAIGAAVGIATVPVLGPGAAVAAAGVGAYVGSLYGAVSNMGDKNDPETQGGGEELRRKEPPRKSGMLVAVSVPASAQQDTAIRILRAHGATDIEHTEGTIFVGEWTDFDPLAPLRLVAD